MKTNKRLSCTFIDNNSNHHQQNQIIKPLKPCLRLPKNSERHFPDHHLDLPSINFEHFIESTRQPENNQPNHRKRVCIITDKPLGVIQKSRDYLFGHFGHPHICG